MSAEYCERCHNSRYLLGAEGDRAVALICPDCAAHCPICKDEGTLLHLDERGYEVLESCRCQALRNRTNRFNSAGIPARYGHCQLTNYNALGGNQREIHRRVSKHLDDFVPGRPGLILAGNVGTGKTHLMVAVLRELTLEKGIPARFVEFTHLLADIKEGFNQGRSEADVLGPVSRVAVLGIDELGKGLTTEWQLSILDEVISRRYNAGRTTYFTTNLPTSERTPTFDAPVTSDSGNLRRALETVQLVDRVGERIVSRLHEMCALVEVDGPDYRRSRH